MNDDKNINTIEVNTVLDETKIGTVGEYINFLLESESREDPENAQLAKKFVESIELEILKKPSTKLNLTAFLLSAAKTNKNVGSYYVSLFQKYSNQNKYLANISEHHNIFNIVESLLNEANVIVHPDNEVDKYFAGANYAFAVGIKVEEFYKYIPDQSLQDLLQQTIRLRIAFLMTLLQMRTEKYGTLNDVYLNSGIYGREISLCVLFHSLVALSDESKTLIEKFNYVLKSVEEDVKKGVLQLPERGLFKLSSLKSKRQLKKDFETYFVKELDYSNSGILKIFSALQENIEKIKSQVFPVVAVKDPITGRLVKIQLTKHGPQVKEMEEIEIPKLYVLNDDIEEYIRKQIARRLAEVDDESLEVIVADVLHEKDLDSESTIRAVVNIVRPAVYAVENWNRKLLFWLNSFDSNKTVFGNLVSALIARSFLPAATKEKLENIFNIRGTTIFATVLGLGIAGLPAGVVLGLVAIGVNKITKAEKMEFSFAKSFLNGVFAYSRNDLHVLSVNGSNPYLQLLRFIASEDKSVLTDYANIYNSSSKTGFLNFLNIFEFSIAKNYYKYFTIVNDFGVKRAENTKYALSGFLGIVKLVSLKIGFPVGDISKVLRRSRENIEIIRNLTNSVSSTIKKNEAFELLNIFAKNSALFGLQTSVLGAMMLKDLTQRSVKRQGLFGLAFINNFINSVLTPSHMKAPGESFLYSYTGRTLQKVSYALGQSVGVFSKRNGPAILKKSFDYIGNTGGRVSQNLLNLGNGKYLNRATVSAATMIGGISIFALAMTAMVTPVIVSTNTSYFVSTGRGGSTASSLPSAGSCTNGFSNTDTAYDMGSAVKAKVLAVPYLNQVIADPAAVNDPEKGAVDSANGVLRTNAGNVEIKGAGNMCGAASSVMMAAYYNKLPLANSQQGSYSTVIQDYMYMDKSQSPQYVNPGSCRSTDLRSSSNPNVKGAFYMTSGAYRYGGGGNCATSATGISQSNSNDMGVYLAKFGLKMVHLDYGDMKTFIYPQIKLSIDSGFPLIMGIQDKDAGHLDTIIGYTQDSSGNILNVVSNDPYASLQYGTKTYGGTFSQYISRLPYSGSLDPTKQPSSGFRAVYDLTLLQVQNLWSIQSIDPSVKKGVDICGSPASNTPISKTP